METDCANNRRQVDTEQAVEAMDTQDCDAPINHFVEMDENFAAMDTNMQIINSNVETAPATSTTTTNTTVTAMDVQPACDPAEEETRSEATFQFVVENFSKLKESVLSPPCYVRNLPWKIMVMPRSERSQPDSRSLGFFLQCNGESESSSWSCNAIADLRLRSFLPNQEPFSRKIKHLFYSKENDWGFSYFLPWNEILDPEKGYVQNDTIVLEVHVTAEAPHGVFWDSKKHTGYVGLKNQGATCYMNSLLQTLFFTNQLRKSVYKMPTEADDSSKSVALALQRVFHDLQFTNKPVGTKKLTKSFGWEALDSFMQHDVQEFLRVLLDKLESKMKGTCVEGTVPSLFEGKMSSYIKCKNVDYASRRKETFYDIQLNIKGKKNIYESFKDYVAPETLDGDNKYDAGEFGLQEAEKGVIFLSFPPVLHLHLMRFQYDPITDNSVKFNDRFDFYEEISLDPYLAEMESTPADYKLHAVLVHSGDNHGGHYVVYINPSGDGKWCKFDDDVVSRCSKSEAIDQNYGGMDDEMSLNTKHCSNAYMLVYIRKSAMPSVLQPITEEDIPTELTERLEEEKRMELVRRRERSESNTYVIIQVLLEEYLEGHQCTDLFDMDKVHYRIFKMKKTQLMSDLIATFVETFKVPQNRMRIWPLILRHQITRPVFFDFNEEMNRQMMNVVELHSPWTIFLELCPADSPYTFTPFDKKRDVLTFFKYYDPVEKRLNYVGFGQYQLQMKLADLVVHINERLGFPADSELTVYEEIQPNTVEKLTVLTDTLEKVLKTTRDDVQGNILIFEKKLLDERLELPTCAEYFRDLLCRMDVTFLDKMNPNDTGFTLELSQRNTYDQMAHAVGQKINTDPYEIQFFKSQGFKDLPGSSLRCSSDGNLKEILTYNKPKAIKKIYYQRLNMNINELENKKLFKCLWLSSNLKDEKELVLYPNKNGTVKTLLDEAAKQIEFNEDSTRKLRLVEVASHKIYSILRDETPLEHLQNVSDSSLTNHSGQKFYRIEEITRDELFMNDDEGLIPISHFCKEIYNSFGVPFFMKAKHGELYTALKERIQKRLSVPDKEWEKYKFAFIAMARVEYKNDANATIDLADYKPHNTAHTNIPLPYLGLEHINKSQKRSRYTYMEKAIKIYN